MPPTRINPRCRQPAADAGFTLIELMAVIVIMAIMITIGIVSLPKMSKAAAMNRAVNQIVRALEVARQTAITSRVWTRMYFHETAEIGVAISNTYYVSSFSIPEAGGSSFFAHSAYPDNSPNRFLPTGARIDKASLQKFPSGYQWGPGYSGKLGIFYRVRQGYLNPSFPTTVPGVNTNLFNYKVLVGQKDFTGGNWQFHVWIPFSPRGEAEITATVKVYEVSSQSGSADTNSPNYAYIITQAGSGRVRVVRPEGL